MNKNDILYDVLLPAVKLGIIVAGADIMHSLFFGHSMTQRVQVYPDRPRRGYAEYVRSNKRYSGTRDWEGRLKND